MAEKQAEAAKSAQDQADKISSLTVEIKTRGGENGKLFGSVTSKDISAALLEQHKIKVDKKKIVMDNPIKETGISVLTVKLYPDITAQLKVKVVTE